MQSPTVRLSTFVSLALLTASVACSRDGASRPQRGEMVDSVVASAPMGEMANRGFAVEAKVAADQSAQPPQSTRTDSVAPGMIIRNGNVSIEVESLEPAVAAVRALAAKLGGYVGNVSTSTGQYSVRSSTLELKIPAPRFDEAMSGLTPIGRVEQSNTTAEDVGEEFVDLTARMANSKRLEERLVSLLATRAGKLEDVLAVERELSRVREEIERVEGRMRFLKTRVAISTLSVTVHEEAPIISPDNPGENVISEAFRDMWRNFVGLVAFVISSLGVVIPIGLVLAIVVWIWRRRGPAKA